MPAPLTENGIYPSDHLAKKLNNRASFLISTGAFEECISLLTKALELTEQNNSSNNNENNKTPCSCKCCSFEACLLTDQDSFMTMMDHSSPHHRHHRRRRRHKPVMKDPNGGFVYSRPLLVNQHSIKEGHFMGITLSLIILFNLSLAHHLLAITELKKEKDDNSKGKTGRARAQHALQMYKLAYHGYLQHQQTYTTKTINNNNNKIHENKSVENERSIANIKFTIIISNNTGGIHRIFGNTIIYKNWLQHLLTLIMSFVDNNLDAFDSNEMDGFYHNISPIMTKKICAGAA